MASYAQDLIEPGDETHCLGCVCCRFNSGIDMPIPKKLTMFVIEELALDFSTSIISDWTKPIAIIKRFEAMLQKRWLRKSTR